MKRTPTSRSKSKPKNIFEENKPTLANLMNNYKANDSYNVKINMNHHNPQIIEINSYQLPNIARESRPTWKSKDPFKNLIIINDLNSKQRRDTKYSPNNSNRITQVTPKRQKPGNIKQYQSNQSRKEYSREGYGLFRQIIKKQSKQNSRINQCEYYDLIERKANQIKEEKKAMLQRCHSNGTLTNVLQTMKMNTNNEIDEYARKVMSGKQEHQVSEQRAESKQESKIEEAGNSAMNPNNSTFNSHFSFQIDTVQNQHSPKTPQNIDNNIFDYFGSQGSQIQNQTQNESAKEKKERPFSKISHSSHNTQKHVLQVGKTSQITTDPFPRITSLIVSRHNSPKVQLPVNRFIEPKLATVFTEIEFRPESKRPTPKGSPPFVQMVQIVKKNTVNVKDKWIKIERPEHIDYILDAIDKPSTDINANDDFLRTNNFNYPFENHH